SSGHADGEHAVQRDGAREGEERDGGDPERRVADESVQEIVMPALRVRTAEGWVEIKGDKGDPGLTPEEVELVAADAAAAAVDANPTIADHETRIETAEA